MIKFGFRSVNMDEIFSVLLQDYESIKICFITYLSFIHTQFLFLLQFYLKII